MKMVNVVILICVALCIDCAVSLTIEEFNRLDDAFSKTLCQRDDTALEDDINKCEEKLHAHAKEKFTECRNKAYPENEKKPGSIRRARCKDSKIAKTYQKCMEPYLEDEEFLKKLGESKETKECNKKALERHGAYKKDLDVKKD